MAPHGEANRSGADPGLVTTIAHQTYNSQAQEHTPGELCSGFPVTASIGTKFDPQLPLRRPHAPFTQLRQRLDFPRPELLSDDPGGVLSAVPVRSEDRRPWVELVSALRCPARGRTDYCGHGRPGSGHQGWVAGRSKAASGSWKGGAKRRAKCSTQHGGRTQVGVQASVDWRHYHPRSIQGVHSQHRLS